MEPGTRLNFHRGVEAKFHRGLEAKFHRGLEAKFHRVVEVLCSTEAVGDNIGIGIPARTT